VILERLRGLLAIADRIERRLQVAAARAEKLPQSILSKAFSGELVPTEAELARAEGRTYETADELRARVRQTAGEVSGVREVNHKSPGRGSKKRSVG
jgi:type I restriction enzyme S subunit